ncbi:uncharacterized protein I303_106635 [Kwoniella dejecticola CBS 10117]|uniref:Uncharacterized protein n=1 Tax=Kwoniella dejecticola CBS 10117 TaxID=1296121 RepID=A0A1A5ZU62_9TREE|nr:uncharacterized protein I303_08722 [Kwoniella dejecticola CBS 10117]OBR81335.1 hypothetical protein I303_08722 [Kwoniella dejecticola CBS 10117]
MDPTHEGRPFKKTWHQRTADRPTHTQSRILKPKYHFPILVDRWTPPTRAEIVTIAVPGTHCAVTARQKVKSKRSALQTPLESNSQRHEQPQITVTLQDHGASPIFPSRQARSTPPSSNHLGVLSDVKSPCVPHKLQTTSNQARLESFDSASEGSGRVGPPCRGPDTRKVLEDLANSQGHTKYGNDTRYKPNRSLIRRSYVKPLLEASENVLDSEKLDDTTMGVLKQYFWNRSIHTSLWKADRMFETDGFDKGNSRRKAYEERAVLEIGLEVVRRIMSELSDGSGRTEILSDYRVFIPDRWNPSSVVGESIRLIEKLGGTVCSTEEDLLCRQATTHIRLTGLSALADIGIHTDRWRLTQIKSWDMYRLVKSLIIVCDKFRKVRQSTLEKLQGLAQGCGKTPLEIGVKKAVYISISMDPDHATAIGRICDAERFTIKATLEELRAFDGSVRIVVVKEQVINSDQKSTSPHAIRKMTSLGFYNFVVELRKAKRQSDQRKSSLKGVPRALTKGLPPIVATGPPIND